MNGNPKRIFFDAEDQYTNDEKSLIINYAALKYGSNLSFKKELLDQVFSNCSLNQILMSLYYFDFNLNDCYEFIEEELPYLINMYSPPQILDPFSAQHELIINILSSGCMYCSGRDKKYRPNIYFNLDLLEVIRTTKDVVNKFVIDNHYYQSFDL